jgi:hypothetical protein
MLLPAAKAKDFFIELDIAPYMPKHLLKENTYLTDDS